jgi:hypothetical protein
MSDKKKVIKAFVERKRKKFVHSLHYCALWVNKRQANFTGHVVMEM